MNNLRVFISAARVLPILLLLAPGASSAQTAAGLFDDSVLHTLHIAIHSRDWNELRANYLENRFYPGDVTWNGVRVHNVGIRSRGYGSRSPTKPGLELDFQRYSTQGQFLGLRSLVLDNLITDLSMIRERTAMAFLRRFGVPAPREAHAKVFVNGEYAGLYAMVEPVDTTFAQRTLGDSLGTLHEFRWIRPYYAEDLGDNLDLYAELFEPRSQQVQSTFDLYGPVRELVRHINDAPTDTFLETVGAQLDLDATVHMIAAETFLVEIDGILGYAGMNNVYLHRRSTTRQHQFLPWDKDHTFYQWDYPLMTGAYENALMRRILEHPELRSRYADRLLEAVALATDGDWLEREIWAAYEQIREAALADPLKPYSNEEFEQTVATLIEFARRRPSFVVQEIHQQLAH
jgi:spore coat protein CotH